MIKSMTGFGRGSAEGDHVKATVEIRAVNNRHLDVHVRLPQELASMEIAIKKQVAAALKRGRVDATIGLERATTSSYSVNREAIRSYLDAFQVLKDEFGFSGDVPAEAVLRLPGILQSGSETTGTEADVALVVTEALTAALVELVAMRAVEGAELAAEMSSRLDRIESLVPSIEARAVDLPSQYRDRLDKRLAELVRGKPLDETRLAQEVAYLAERTDIAEELARLKSHLTQFRQAMTGDSGETGKRLDFLLQEMNREANTTLSKSGDVDISESAITIKTEVEKLREQVQNVE